MRQGAAAAALLLAAGCGNPAPAPAPPVTLSTQNPGDNVAPIVAFFRRTCVENFRNLAAFEDSIASSGWHTVKTQSEGRSEEGNMMPTVWRLDHGELVLTSLPPMPICMVSLRSDIAPRMSTLRAALLQAIVPPAREVLREDASGGAWAWPDRPGFQQVLTITVIPASRGETQQGVSVNLSIEPIPTPGGGQE